MLCVSDETREQILRLGREEFGGASADETVRRLLDEHWQHRACDAARLSQISDPEAWAEYLDEAEALVRADAPVIDDWIEGR